MVASLTGRGRPTHARVTVTLLQIAMDTHTPPRHYSLLHKRTLTESGSQLKACGGGEGWGLFKAKSVPARGWAGALARLQLARACPGLLGAGGGGWGVGEGLLVGRTSRTSRSQGQKTSHGGGSNNVLCILCRHLAESRTSAPHAGTRGLGLASTCSWRGVL